MDKVVEQPLVRPFAGQKEYRRDGVWVDPALQDEHLSPGAPPALTSFDGLSNLSSVMPSDCNGDIGPNHYLEMINVHFRVYDREGTPLTPPLLMSDLFAAAGFTGPAASMDSGDPIVLYDHLADRWMISQFIVRITPCRQVMAISQTPDPTGAWHLYDFPMPNNMMNDYPKYGVWPDGYYMTDVQFDSTNGFSGHGIFVFDRDAMLRGDPDAGYQYIDLGEHNRNLSPLLPADLDGPAPPAGTPNYMSCVMNDEYGYTEKDSLLIWEMHTDWQDPTNTRLGLNGGDPNQILPVADFSNLFSKRIPQPDTAMTLDPLADRLLFRLQYRYWPGASPTETLVANHTVVADGDSHAGVRYYVLRSDAGAGDNWWVEEQGTYAPDDRHRWMASAAMDGAGALAIGFSISDATETYPSIGYAARQAQDAPGSGMTAGESILHAGSGSQTWGYRWGDYTMLAVDPLDDVTFWYINQYLPETSGAGWQTRISSFRVSATTEATGLLTGVVRDVTNNRPVPNAIVRAIDSVQCLTTAEGVYRLYLPEGPANIQVRAQNYLPSTITTANVVAGSTTTLNLVLQPEDFSVLPLADIHYARNKDDILLDLGREHVLRNGSYATLDYAVEVSEDWLSATPARGSIPPLSTVTVSVATNYRADLLTVGQHTGSVRFRDLTHGTSETLEFSLDIAPGALENGYERVYLEDFESGQPAGWSLVGNTSSNLVWRFDDPGYRTNLTGGEGDFAIIDHDYYGRIEVDAELRTHSFDFSSYRKPVLSFQTYFERYQEVADVDFSLNGPGGPWTNVWRRTSSYKSEEPVVLDLSHLAGEPSVMLRFRYHDANWGWYWQIDDVALYDISRPGDLQVLPGSMSSVNVVWGKLPDPARRIFEITNISSTETLSWSARTSTSLPAWLKLDKDSGSLEPNASSTVEVRFNSVSETLPVGRHEGVVLFTNESQALTTDTIERRFVLDVEEPLNLTPADTLLAFGVEGGPFTISPETYGLRNASSRAIDWRMESGAEWIGIMPSSGTLAAGASAELIVDAQGLESLAHGEYVTTLLLRDLSGSGAEDVPVAVEAHIFERFGEIAVEDSIVPEDDLRLPLGAVPAFETSSGQITIRNTDPEGGRDLILRDISLGMYEEDFEDGLAEHWVSNIPSQWSVSSGTYVVQPTSFTAYSYYSRKSWYDYSLSLDVIRYDSTSAPVTVMIGMVGNFQPAMYGDALFLSLWENTYSVASQIDGELEVLQNFTTGKTINNEVGGVNTIQVSRQLDTIALWINGTLTWTGSWLGAYESSRIGLMAPVPGDSRIGFDNIVVNRPRIVEEGLGRKQTYLNANPLTEDSTFLFESPGAAQLSLFHTELPALVDSTARSQPRVDATAEWTLTGRPAFPHTLAPGESLQLSLNFHPMAPGESETLVHISSSDNNEGSIWLDGSGRAESGTIRGYVKDVHSGRPLESVLVTVASLDDDRRTSVSTNSEGRFSLSALLGRYALRFERAGYQTVERSGIVIAEDGQPVSVNVALDGPYLTLSPSGINQLMRLDDEGRARVDVRNPGSVDCDFSILFFEGEDRLGDTIASRNVEQATGSDLNMGVEYALSKFWVTASDGLSSNVLAQFDAEMNYITKSPQGTSGRGWRDLCFDGRWLYASAGDSIDQIDPASGLATGVTIPGPLNLNRGLAYDPETDHFWCADGGSPIFEINRAGDVLSTFSQTRNIYGLSWNASSAAEPMLWVWLNGDSAPEAHEFNPREGRYTGRHFDTGQNIGGYAGGSDIAVLDNQTRLIVIHQAAADVLAQYALGSDLDWLEANPSSASLLAGDGVELDIDMRALRAGTLSGSVMLDGGFVNSPLYLPVTIDVEDSLDKPLVIVDLPAGDLNLAGHQRYYHFQGRASAGSAGLDLVLYQVNGGGLEHRLGSRGMELRHSARTR